MLPSPLHPAAVHFPVVLAFLLPFFAVGAMWTIRRGANRRRAWLLPVAGAVALASSAWAAVETGQLQSERVERIVAEQAIESHEEMAEVFLAASASVAAIAVIGLLGGFPGRAARIATVVGSLALIALVARVGHSGGELVYRYGAANAYTTQSGAAPGDVVREPAATRAGERRGDRDER